MLPKALLGRLSEPEREALLVRELAHLRRRDHWVRFLELAALTLYWWHPVAWWASRRLRVAEERCCDALVPDVDLSAPVTVELDQVPRDQALEKLLQIQHLASTREGELLWIYGADGRHSPARTFSGEPIDLDLKDAALGDVLESFGRITGIRFPLDAGVEGLVTVRFKQVPWDQAVDAILRLQGLTYTAEGNEVRVFRAL